MSKRRSRRQLETFQDACLGKVLFRPLSLGQLRSIRLEADRIDFDAVVAALEEMGYDDSAAPPEAAATPLTGRARNAFLKEKILARAIGEPLPWRTPSVLVSDEATKAETRLLTAVLAASGFPPTAGAEG